MNFDPEGPFYRGLKMLGRKEGPTEILTQGSFVKYLLRLISKKPDRDLIAVSQRSRLHRLAVDERPIGTVPIGQHKHFSRRIEADPRMNSRDLIVIEPNDIQSPASERDLLVTQFKPGTLIGTLNYEQRRLWHESHPRVAHAAGVRSRFQHTRAPFDTTRIPRGQS